MTSRHFVYGGWEILPQDFIVALYDSLSNENLYVTFAFPYTHALNVRGERRRVARWKGSFPWRSGVAKVAFDPEGLPISHLPPEGDFVHSFRRGEEGEGVKGQRYIYWTKSRSLLSLRNGRRTKQRRKRIQVQSLEFQYACVRISFWRDKDEGKTLLSCSRVRLLLDNNCLLIIVPKTSS